MLIIFLVFGSQQEDVHLLRWAGPEGSRPESYEEWVMKNPVKPFSFLVSRKILTKDNPTVAIITEQSIYNSILNELNQLISDLQKDYNVLDIVVSGGTPENLKDSLISLYNLYNIEGALFIGNLPVAWFEIANDFNTYGYADFPIDLFYMDLNGVWLDTMSPGNGKYDGHSGDMFAEIYVGRLIPTGIGNDTLLIKNYLVKDHNFREGTILLQKRALFFCDDDWIPWASYWAQNLSLLYPDTMNFWDAETTRGTIYSSKLDSVQAWVSVFAHSWPGGHQFKYNNGSSYDYFYSGSYTTKNPPSNFYNFFACSFARYTSSGYGAGRAIFNQSYGIGAIGSTKTGSMLDFEYFYQPLANGKTIGEAFKDWFNYIISGGVTFSELCWHYGMTLLGDPFIRPLGHNVGIEELSNLKKINSIFKGKIILELNIPLKIKIYELTGRIIYEEKIITKQNKREIEIKNKGIYFIRIETDKETVIKKILLL